MYPYKGGDTVLPCTRVSVPLFMVASSAATRQSFLCIFERVMTHFWP
jgi:hypothetical protein